MNGEPGREMRERYRVAVLQGRVFEWLEGETYRRAFERTECLFFMGAMASLIDRCWHPAKRSAVEGDIYAVDR